MRFFSTTFSFLALPKEQKNTTYKKNIHCSLHLPQGHQPEDLPDPHGDRHVRQPVEPVHQEGLRVRLPRLLERHAGKKYHFDVFDIVCQKNLARNTLKGVLARCLFSNDIVV